MHSQPRPRASASMPISKRRVDASEPALLAKQAARAATPHAHWPRLRSDHLRFAQVSRKFYCRERPPVHMAAHTAQRRRRVSTIRSGARSGVAVLSKGNLNESDRRHLPEVRRACRPGRSCPRCPSRMSPRGRADSKQSTPANRSASARDEHVTLAACS
jgi:hypothetical protein